MTHIAERCVCGASITVDDEGHAEVLKIVDEWRKYHKHVEPEPPARYRAIYNDQGPGWGNILGAKRHPESTWEQEDMGQ